MEIRKFIATTIGEYLNEQQTTNIKTPKSNKSFLYHGSGADFSDTFIGSGIGNNSFGYGIYLTDTKKSAKGWAETLEKTSNVLIDGIKPSREVEKFLSNAVDLHGNKSDLLLHILKMYLDSLSNGNKISKKEYDFIEKSSELKLTRSRFIYKVIVNGDDFIYWNSPITKEQIIKVKKQVTEEEKNIDIIIDDEIKINGRTIINGEGLYSSLGMPQQEISAFLYRCGIDGVIFYSYGTNYVIFNPKSILVKKKINF